MKKLLLLTFLVLSLPSRAYIEKNLTRLTMQNGMPDNTVYGITKDPDGFVWFATDNGVARYDGVTLKNYALPSKSQATIGIKCNENNLVWIYGAQGSIFCLDRQTESFIPIKGYVIGSKRATTQTHIASDSTIYDISNRKLRVWRLKFDRKTRQIEASIENEIEPLAGSSDLLMSITTDVKGTIYMTTRLWRVAVVDPRTMDVQWRQMEVKQTTTQNMAISSATIIDSSLWLTSIGQGVIRYSLTHGTTQQLSGTVNKEGLSVPHDGVYGITRLSRNEYIVATWNGYGVLVFDERDEKLIGVRNYSNTYSEIHRSSESRFTSVYTDKDNVLYLGTYGSGVFVSDLREQFYNQSGLTTHGEGCTNKRSVGNGWIQRHFDI